MLIGFFSILNSYAKKIEDNEKLIINKVIAHINQHYVFPEVAKELEVFLHQQLINNRYESYNTPSLLAIKLTKDLQKIAHDKHLRVRSSTPKKNDKSKKLSALKDPNLGFRSAEIIKGNIGYLIFDSFSSDLAARKIIDNTFQQFKDVDGLIIDLRNNTGGSPELIETICSYLFANRTQLNSIYQREGNQTIESWTTGDSSLLNLTRVPIYVLISSKTFSAAEALSYDLQQNKRALIIGETSKGGANPGKSFPLTQSLDIFIPTGSAINPITKTNWEGTGVKPDDEINQLFAFELAHELAIESAIKHRVKYGKASIKEKYQKSNAAPIYGTWRLAKNGCPLKLRIAPPQYNEVTAKYQTPYKIKYYGNGSFRIKFKLGTKNKKYQQNLYFKDRKDEKSGISAGFSKPEEISISQCKF